MTIRSVVAAFILITLSSAASAHAELDEATPSDGSILSASPAHIELRFAAPVRVTNISIKKESGESQPLDGVSKDPAKQFSVRVPKLAPGRYVITWRAMGNDGHVGGGTIRFELKPSA